jgi:hypothetical protein
MPCPLFHRCMLFDFAVFGPTASYEPGGSRLKTSSKDFIPLAVRTEN